MKLSYIESKIFGKVCYGFRRNKDGIVETIPDKAEVVKMIFSLYLDGNSLENIQYYLLDAKIPSPSGKEKWSRDILNKLPVRKWKHKRIYFYFANMRNYRM